MKTTRFIPWLVVVLMLVVSSAQADGYRRPEVRVQFCTPFWVPASIVRHQTRHVYFPQYNVYYDRLRDHFIYERRGRWMVSYEIPGRMRQVDWRRVARVGIHVNTNRPHMYNARHRARFARNERCADVNTRDRRGSRNDNRRENRNDNRRGY